jgi:DNA-binding XRE family transcriptional regulator/phage-related protein
MPPSKRSLSSRPSAGNAQTRGRTQAVFYRDKRGQEPVDAFLEELLRTQPLAVAKIDDAIEEHLNGRDPRDPPPEFPATSQIEGELRELRVRFARTRYRVLYQRSRNLLVLLHAFEKHTGAVSASDRRKGRGADGRLSGEDGCKSSSTASCGAARRSSGVAWELRRLISRDKLYVVATVLDGPVGKSAAKAAKGRADRNAAYRDARAEYQRIRALREVSPVAAHLRERRFELGLTQEEVAKAAGTSHSAISRLEKGTHIPQLPTLRRIAAVLDEELMVCFQRMVDGEVEREFAAVA